jgi:hypothetical protein
VIIKTINDKDGEWHKWFAWHPAFTDTAIVWLEPVERRWNPELNGSGDFSGHTYATGGWEYRQIQGE